MASSSVIGSQYVFSDNTGQPINLQHTTDGSQPPAAIAGDYNLDVQIIDSSFTGNPNSLHTPPGYQALALVEDNGQQLVLLHGNLGVTDTGVPGQTDTIIGGNGHDTINGGGAPNLAIIGGRGPDTILGGSGPETIIGGRGPDTILGGSGPETIIGGGGRNFVVGGSGNDTLIGGPGHNTIAGGGGDNTIFAQGVTTVADTGVKGADTVYGFDRDGGDRITFQGEDKQTIHQVISSQTHANGNTTLTLPDGSTITLVGIHHVGPGFFK